ncbi:MAG TPA: alanine--tRNA ligase, partial [Anaerolineae bacterium]|nr:alanine--tRNA ligase [Anaerolineae bacterium]
MGEQFPELKSRRQFILTTITQEEKRFLRTLDLGLARLNEVLSDLKERGERNVPGEAAFRLYDTFGLPLEITRDVARERGLLVDEQGYAAALEEQRRRARQTDTFTAQDAETMKRYQALLASLQEQGALPAAGVAHDPYSTTELETTVIAILKDGQSVSTARPGDEVEIVLPATCFYVESGGQVSDQGFIAAYPPGSDVEGEADEEVEPLWDVTITEARRPVPGLIVHVGKVVAGRPRVGDRVWAVVDYDRRISTARNHTATHLLHSELRYILGEHVQQAGSLVTPERLRFDFTHPTMLTEEELDAITLSVNDAILVNYPVITAEEPYRQAIDEGVIALFGEKYGDVVRVVRVGWPEQPFSQELCGGTHVEETGEIGLFHIVSEEGVGAGVRRIEAVTGRVAVELVEQQINALKRAAAYIGAAPEEIDRRTLNLLGELRAARKEIQRLQEKLARQEFEALLSKVEEVEGVPLLSAQVSAPAEEVLREMTDWFRDRLGSGVVVLGAVLGERPRLVAAVTPDWVQRGVDAVKLVRPLSKVIGGGGGGQPTLAQAGGRDASRLGEALEQAAEVLRKMLGE